MKGGTVLGIVAGLAAIVGLGALVGKSTGLIRAKGPTLLIGDSLAVGLGPAFAGLGLNIDHHGVVGVPIAYWNASGQDTLKAALQRNPAIILVSLGTNDAYTGDGYAETAASNARKLLEQLKKSGAYVAWVGPPQLPSSYGGRAPSQKVLDAIKQVVTSTPGALWIDSTQTEIPRSPDKLHPSSAGYTSWAEEIVDQLANLWGLVPSAVPSTSSAPTSLQGDFFGADRPPPPKVIPVPQGWEYAFGKLPKGITVWAINTLGRRLPLGDLQVKQFNGNDYGAFTEYHYDDHVDGVLKWHPGVSILWRKG